MLGAFCSAWRANKLYKQNTNTDCKFELLDAADAETGQSAARLSAWTEPEPARQVSLTAAGCWRCRVFSRRSRDALLALLQPRPIILFRSWKRSRSLQSQTQTTSRWKRSVRLKWLQQEVKKELLYSSTTAPNNFWNIKNSFTHFFIKQLMQTLWKMLKLMYNIRAGY